MKKDASDREKPDYALAKRVHSFLSGSANRRSGSPSYHISWIYSSLEKLGVDVEWKDNKLTIGSDVLHVNDDDRIVFLDLLRPLYRYCFGEDYPRYDRLDIDPSYGAYMAYGLSAFRERIRLGRPVTVLEIRTYALEPSVASRMQAVRSEGERDRPVQPR